MPRALNYLVWGSRARPGRQGGRGWVYGLGNEAGQGLQGSAQHIQTAFKGSQAGLQLLVLGVQLGHEVVHDILGLPETQGVGGRGEAR